jgi:hypothetical protein
MSHQPVTKERLEAAKQKLIDLESNMDAPEEVAADNTAEVEPPPFGGGHLVGLMINPSSIELQNLVGFDKYGFSFSRSYGGSLYLPLVEHCITLQQSSSQVLKQEGDKHINDRFMLIRDTSPPLTDAEQAMYNAAQDVGQQLLDKGALPPLVFPKVEVMGHFGPEILKNHYIPSCGIEGGEDTIIEAFTAYMSKLDRWIWETV